MNLSRICRKARSSLNSVNLRSTPLSQYNGLTWERGLSRDEESRTLSHKCNIVRIELYHSSSKNQTGFCFEFFD